MVATQNVSKADGSGNHDVPETISFTIPKDTYSNNGVYLSMYVDAMGYAPDAFLQIDYAEKRIRRSVPELYNRGQHCRGGAVW